MKKEDGQTYLIILGAGPQQEKLYKLARDLKYMILGIDIDVSAVAKKYCDIFLNVSIKDTEEIIRRLSALKTDFCGVVTCGAEVSPQVASIAEKFNLIGIPYEVAVNTTDKFARSKALQSAGVNVPAFQKVENESDVQIELPVVIKPVDSSGSRGVSLVRESSELGAAIAHAKGVSKTDFVVCEEFIENGVEVSIESFVVEGTPYITGIAERHFLDVNETFPEFVEYGGTMPPTFSKELSQECEDIFCKAIRSLGITGGPSKGDLIIRNGEVAVLEVTSRTSPGFAAEMQPLNSGVEPLVALLKWSTGVPFDLDLLRPKFSRGVAHRYYRHSPGIIRSIEGFDVLSEHPDIKYYLILNLPEVGDSLAPMSYMNRLFYVITEGDSNFEAIEKAEAVLGAVKIETTQ